MSSSNNNNVAGKRNDFLDKVQKEANPEEKDPRDCGSSCDASKPRGTFLEPVEDQHKQVFERKAPSCGYRGG